MLIESIPMWLYISGLVVVPIFILLLWIKKVKSIRLHELQSTFAFDEIIYEEDMANFMGIKSLGMTQIRGNGIFIILSDKLFFSLFFPRKDIEIPRSSITGIRTEKAFLGKTKFKPLVVIDFTSESGSKDSVGFLVAEPETVIATLQETERTP